MIDKIMGAHIILSFTSFPMGLTPVTNLENAKMAGILKGCSHVPFAEVVDPNNENNRAAFTLYIFSVKFKNRVVEYLLALFPATSIKIYDSTFYISLNEISAIP